MAGSSTVQLTVSGPGGTEAATLPQAVTVKPGPLAELVASPIQITLLVQDTTRLGATALDQFGNEISDIAFTWSAASPVGSIEENGLFTAGTQAGTYRGFVKVIATQGEQSGEAATDVTITPGPVSRVVVEPNAVTLDIGETQSFTFSALDEFGNEIADTLAGWAMQDNVGALDGNGLFRAGTRAGTFAEAIRVDVVKGTERLSASADVSIRPDPLVTIEVQPTSIVLLEEGSTQQFTAVGVDQYGNDIPGLAFLWEATGGQIDQAGLFIANRFGPSEVTASATFDNGTATGTASVVMIGRYGGTLRVGMGTDHTTFDPPKVLGLPDIVTIQHTYDPLVMRNPDLSLQPMLAESWTTNHDASEWTFKLRQGVKFHHGKEFKAEDVVFTFNRLFEVGSPLARVMAKPTAIVAVDDYTVRFEFASPNAVLLKSLVKHHAHITPSEGVNPQQFATETFGTGPFILTEYVVGARATFRRNPDYWWEGHPYVDELVFFFVPSPEARAQALKAGSIDVIYDLDTASGPTLEAHPDTVVAQAPSGRYMNLAMDVREPPFDNVLVRKALQAATDRQAILQGTRLGLGGIAYDHPVTPTDPVFNESCKPPEYNPALARSLLAEAGYPNGINLTLYTSTVGPAVVEMVGMATVFKEKAAPAGINIRIVVMPENTYWSQGWMVKPFTTVWWSGRPPYEAFSVVYPSGAPWNEAHYSNPRVDALLEEAQGTADLEDQKKIYAEIQCIVVDEVPRIIPVFLPVLLGLRNEVWGVEPMWDATLSLHRAWLDR